MVEPVGVEPTSENSSTTLSSSGVYYIFIRQEVLTDKSFLLYRHSYPLSYGDLERFVSHIVDTSA